MALEETTLEKIWTELDCINNIKDTMVVNVEYICTNCESTNIKEYDGQSTCCECGLVLSDMSEYYDNSTTSSRYENESSVYNNKKTCGKYKKIKQMQEWYKWTNDEKIKYKLTLHTEQFCNTLGVSDNIIPMVVDTVVSIMSIIKENYGTKRAKVKDGIIIMCIYLVSKNTENPLSYNEMAKKMKIDMKYVSRADGLIVELINSKKIQFKSELKVQDTKTPYEYIIETINKNKLNVSDILVKKIKILIEICEDNDLLIDHSPHSIGACCFYYILKKANDSVNIKVFSNLTDLSIVTIMKTYNKLKIYDKELEKYGI